MRRAYRRTASGNQSKRPKVHELVEHLVRRHRVHTVILYGSRAKGTDTASSDWDLVALRRGAPARDVRRWRGLELDLFVDSEGVVAQAARTEELRLLGGVVLLDARGLGARWLRRLERLRAKGPGALPADQRRTMRVWAWKMVERASEPTAYGRYRRVQLLESLLPHAYALKREFFPGAKQALAELDAAMLRKWDAALKPSASSKSLAALVRGIVGLPPRV